MKMEATNRAELVGFVVRKWVSNARGFATIDLDIPNDRGSAKLRVRSFGKDGLIDQIDALKPGQKVRVICTVESECLKDKAKVEVKIDGFKKFVEVLTVRSIEVDATSVQRPALDEKPKSDDDIPAGW
jgi:hypothetical protein